VERIARLLGAGLTVDSVPGKGTRIGLSVPLAVEAPIALREAPPIQLSTTAGMTVLCIDNDEKILAGMTALLSGWGCQPYTAKAARDAVRVLKTAGQVPDLMLIDYHLDEGDGLTALAEVRRRLSEDVPAILVTADRSAELKERAARVGVRVLNKPVKPAALRALMAQWSVRRPAAE
jgi:CheY-like chemotaxis protein